VKSSGHADEVTGIDSRITMQSHLLEPLSSCRWRPAPEAERF
jgi:hypothetical protein